MPTSQSVIYDADAWTRWVPAAPFGAWLCHLAAATGLEPTTIAVAAGVPISVGRRLAQGDYQHHRIRMLDAKSLMALDAEKLQQMGARLTDSGIARRALNDLGLWRPDAQTLAERLGVSIDVAQGLLNGWLVTCPMSVIWHCLALTQDIVHARTLTAYWPNAQTEPAAVAA